MPNDEMMRPYTLWGYTFDAMKILELGYTPYHYTYSGERKFGAYLDLPDRAEIKSHTVETPEEAFALVSEAITTIADALNAPVLATKEVLAGLPKDANTYTIDEKTGDALRCTFDEQWGWVCGTGHFNEALELGRPYKIFAINDPKTAEYLRQFTLQGVRRVG